LRVIGQRSAQRGLHGLLVDLDREVARGRREGDATTREVRGADRSLARTARALLAERLRAGARDHAATLRGARPLARGVHLGAHGLVDEVRLDLGGEDGLIEGDLLLGSAEHVCLRRSHYDISLISTTPFFGPGIAPLTSRRLRSASTEWTVRPTCV